MHIVDDDASLERVLQQPIDSLLRKALTHRVERLRADGLLQHTELLLVEPGDSEVDIELEVGFSPLRELIDGTRFPEPEFEPFWDWLVDHGGVYELSVSFGSSFAYILLIQAAAGTLPDLLTLCRLYAGCRP